MFVAELSLPSFAKINWSLRVLGKRPDGYHEVRTVLQTVSLHDNLHFVREMRPQVTLVCEHPDVPTDESNLVLRAARLLTDKHNPGLGATIRLEKRIPAKGGLGGASSNAAMTLLALSELWRLNLNLPELIELGTELGADVPFFFLGGRAVGTGIGTQLTPAADYVESKLIIVTPKAGISTAEAYRALNSAALTTPNSARILTSSRTESHFSESDQWPLYNDFEKVIFEMEPEIKRVRKALFAAGAQDVLLAGSGSSVFGIFESAAAQRHALEVIQTEAGWRVLPCNTLSRDEYLRAMGSCGTPLLRSAIKQSDSGA